jgi:hypothetical protein
VNPPLHGANEGTKPTAADYIRAYPEHLGGITPTLTRPHQGGGKTLAMLGGRDKTTGLP